MPTFAPEIRSEPISSEGAVAPPQQTSLITDEPPAPPLPPGGLPITGPEPPLAVPTPAPTVQSDDVEESGPSLWHRLRASPPFLISMALHLAAVVLLALATLANADLLPIEILSGMGSAPEEVQDLGEPAPVQVISELAAESLEPEVAFPADIESPAVLLPEPDALASLLAEGMQVELRVPAVANSLKGRSARQRAELLRDYGGTPETEEAVARGLEWLQRRQAKDGSWNTKGDFANPGSADSRVPGTAMALLAFQGAGHTHRAHGELDPDYSEVVSRGWYALLALQQEDGSFRHNGLNMYAHAQATIALCEIYGMTKDRTFRPPAERAIQFCLSSQSNLGGWRYAPAVDADLSATGWYAMAFQSALMAGLTVPSSAFIKLDKYLDTVGVQNQSLYCYQPGHRPTQAMTAEGLLCRQYLGWKRDDPRMAKGAKFLFGHMPDFKRKNTYCWYYSTQVLHHLGGPDWNRWNTKLRTELPRHQEIDGDEAGSWNPVGDQWANEGGRLYTTCLCLFMLEVYYRHLPIYNHGKSL